MNPYEIAKLLEMDVVQDWFPLTVPSIYTTIKNLRAKGYISGETHQEGKLPPKTIYSLTDEGKTALLDSLTAGLEVYQTPATDFGVSVLHISALPKEEALRLLQRRGENLTELLTKAKSRLDLLGPKIPFNLRMMLTCNVYRLETEIKVTAELIQEAENSSGWDTSFTRYLR